MPCDGALCAAGTVRVLLHAGCTSHCPAAGPLAGGGWRDRTNGTIRTPQTVSTAQYTHRRLSLQHNTHTADCLYSTIHIPQTEQHNAKQNRSNFYRQSQRRYSKNVQIPLWQSTQSSTLRQRQCPWNGNNLWGRGGGETIQQQTRKVQFVINTFFGIISYI